VLVTGVGYIGAALVASLLAAGERVIGFDNGFATDRSALAELAHSGEFCLVDGSVSSARSVARAFTQSPIRTVYHAAAQASGYVAAARARYTETTNLTGPRIVLDAALRAGVERFVYLSSFRVYGDVLPRRLDERAPYGSPPDLAHLSHIYGEKLLESYARRGSVRAVAVRLGVVYGVGPVMKTDYRYMTVPNKFCLQAVRGEPLRVYAGAATPTAFVHLADACAALRAAAEIDWPECFTVANAASEVVTVPDVARIVAQAAAPLGLRVTVHGDGAAPAAAAPRVGSRLTEHGWAPRHTLDDGVADLLQYFRARVAA
jgi:nucleoside-diphosphate-sugar epimerase